MHLIYFHLEPVFVNHAKMDMLEKYGQGILSSLQKIQIDKENALLLKDG